MMRRSAKRMTIASLKRHVDRRFTSLRKDLRRCATKDDLRGFATKDDLRGFATKDDLRGFATKNDLRGFATRDDLAQLEARMDRRFGDVARQFDSLNAKIDAVLSYAREGIHLHGKVIDEHELRLRDLEAQTTS